MKMNTYLYFENQGEAALKFYRDCLGGEIEGLMRFGEAPDCEMPAELHDRLMHGCLRIGDQVLMASDCPPGEHGFRGSEGFSVAVAVETTQDAERVFAALGDGGEVTMPMAETFWAHAFGMLKDRYGVAWMVNCLRDCG